MDLSDHVRRVRRILWWIAAGAWFCVVSGLIIAGSRGKVLLEVIHAGVTWCTILSIGAVLASLIPETGAIAAETYMAGLKAGAAGIAKNGELRSLRND